MLPKVINDYTVKNDASYTKAMPITGETYNGLPHGMVSYKGYNHIEKYNQGTEGIFYNGLSVLGKS